MAFGENLRRERELRGVTLAELAQATKISLRYLNALEQDRFDQLPGGIFNRGFVRAIARYLGLDEREWVSAFVQAAKEEPEILARYAPPPPTATTAPRQSATTFVLLLFLFGAVLFAVHSVRTRRAAEAIPALTPPAPATPNTLAQPAAGSPQPVSEAVAEVRQKSSSLPLPAPQVELHLQVFAIEEAWVSVSGDGRAFYEGLMKPGETRVFRAASKIDLRTGNASALVLTLNGETLPPLGNPGEVKNVSLTHKDLPPRP